MVIPQTDNYARPFVAPLPNFKSTDIVLAGGKGANLGELSNSGFSVPPGFVVTTSAYDLILESSRAQAPLTNLLSSCDFDSPISVKKTSQNISNLFQQIDIPHPLTEEILRAYHHL